MSKKSIYFRCKIFNEKQDKCTILQIKGYYKSFRDISPNIDRWITKNINQTIYDSLDDIGANKYHVITDISELSKKRKQDSFSYFDTKITLISDKKINVDSLLNQIEIFCECNKMLKFKAEK